MVRGVAEAAARERTQQGSCSVGRDLRVGSSSVCRSSHSNLIYTKNILISEFPRFIACTSAGDKEDIGVPTIIHDSREM